MPFWSVKLSVSPSAELKFAVIASVALCSCSESGSETSMPGSTATGGESSTKSDVPPDAATCGGSFTFVVVIVFVETAEAQLPSLTVKSGFFLGDGVSLLDWNLTLRSAACQLAFDAPPGGAGRDRAPALGS